MQNKHFRIFLHIKIIFTFVHCTTAKKTQKVVAVNNEQKESTFLIAWNYGLSLRHKIERYINFNKGEKNLKDS